MLKNIRKHKEGFTIIEVMIVLAIAGLIMLIIFLAVPALERSSRNTQRKNDAAAIAGAIANYIDNNGGALPKSVGNNGTNNVLICGPSCTTGNTETATIGYYDATKAITLDSDPGTAPTTVPNTNSILIVTGYSCNANNTAIGTNSGRSAAILYSVETNSSGGSAEQCTEQ